METTAHSEVTPQKIIMWKNPECILSGKERSHRCLSKDPSSFDLIQKNKLEASDVEICTVDTHVKGASD